MEFMPINDSQVPIVLKEKGYSKIEERFDDPGRSRKDAVIDRFAKKGKDIWDIRNKIEIYSNGTYKIEVVSAEASFDGKEQYATISTTIRCSNKEVYESLKDKLCP